MDKHSKSYMSPRVIAHDAVQFETTISCKDHPGFPNPGRECHPHGGPPGKD